MRKANGRYTVIDTFAETVCDFDDFNEAYKGALTCGADGEMIDNNTNTVIVKRGDLV